MSACLASLLSAQSRYKMIITYLGVIIATHNKAVSDSDKLNARKADHIIYHKSEFSDSIFSHFSNITHVRR